MVLNVGLGQTKLVLIRKYLLALVVKSKFKRNSAPLKTFFSHFFHNIFAPDVLLSRPWVLVICWPKGTLCSKKLPSLENLK